MGVSVFPAPSAASKTAFRTTLISGTSWTVPAGVTYVNVTLYGGGGGNPGTVNAGGEVRPQGGPGSVVSSTLSVTPGASIAYSIGAGGSGGSPNYTNNASAGGTTTFTGATSAPGGGAGATGQFPGPAGTAYRGAGNGPGATANITSSYNGPAGGQGCIDIEYWV